MGWLNFLTGGLGSIVSGVLTPWLNYKSKTADVDLQGFRAGVGTDADTYKAWLAYRAQAESQRAAETSWWGPKLCLMIVALPACLHVALVFVDSSCTFWTGHYGVMGIPPLPGIYASFEERIFDLVVGASVAGPVASAASAWLHRGR